MKHRQCKKSLSLSAEEYKEILHFERGHGLFMYRWEQHPGLVPFKCIRASTDYDRPEGPGADVCTDGRSVMRHNKPSGGTGGVPGKKKKSMTCERRSTPFWSQWDG